MTGGKWRVQTLCIRFFYMKVNDEGVEDMFPSPHKIMESKKGALIIDVKRY